MTVAAGNARLVVNWAAVANATGYKVQWKSGTQSYNTGNRQATITSGSTTSHPILNLTNGTEYTMRVTATRMGANDGLPSAEVMETPAVVTAAGVTVSPMALTVTEQNTTGNSLHGGSRYPADGECDGDGRRARGHGGDPDPVLGHPDIHDDKLEHGPDGDGEGRRTTRT